MEDIEFAIEKYDRAVRCVKESETYLRKVKWKLLDEMEDAGVKTYEYLGNRYTSYSTSRAEYNVQGLYDSVNDKDALESALDVRVECPIRLSDFRNFIKMFCKTGAERRYMLSILSPKKIVNPLRLQGLFDAGRITADEMDGNVIYTDGTMTIRTSKVGTIDA